jgi:formate dehydrogenase subunit delta
MIEAQALDHHNREGAARLVKMANAIGSFFRGEAKREDAVAGIAGHIDKFWTRRMRSKLAAHAAAGGDGLDDLPREAMRQLISAVEQPTQT